MNLYELTTEALELASILENEELTPELEERLKINQNELQAKSINYAKLIRNIEAENEMLDNEIKRLKAMKEARERNLDRLKSNVLAAMQAAGVEKIESPIFKLSVRRSEAVEVSMVELLPDEFTTIKTTVNPNKVAIKNAIKEGKSVPGATLVENFSLQIK